MNLLCLSSIFLLQRATKIVRENFHPRKEQCLKQRKGCELIIIGNRNQSLWILIQFYKKYLFPVKLLKEVGPNLQNLFISSGSGICSWTDWFHRDFYLFFFFFKSQKYFLILLPLNMLELTSDETQISVIIFWFCSLKSQWKCLIWQEVSSAKQLLRKFLWILKLFPLKESNMYAWGCKIKNNL